MLDNTVAFKKVLFGSLSRIISRPVSIDDLAGHTQAILGSEDLPRQKSGKEKDDSAQADFACLARIPTLIKGQGGPDLKARCPDCRGCRDAEGNTLVKVASTS